ncbi:DJ-1/PfpI family protein [Pararhodospirillum photometricum]|uniref:ThiJ/PfpI n=1 Tax=Pararhodospirillum photometricum DSM 122 TaxID=1150469 RepID=H6SIP3_PARPM|nr:DJ-1/PfpI family protein [Pararhodospirillum photometricum]CCG06670.1 ThiJ/PfpI [Pararhodospirillum photometricum DSM 122]
MDVVILVYDGLTPLEAIGPFDILGKLPKARVRVVGLESGLVHSRGGTLGLRASAALEDVHSAEILVVPGGAAADNLAHDPTLGAWLRRVVPTARAVLGVSTGSLILAGAGLLQGVEATTHWRALDLLAGFGAKVVRRRIVTSGTLTTTVGAAAGMDAALAIADQVAGRDVALAIAQLLGYDPEPALAPGDLFKAPDARLHLARTGLEHP